MKKIPAINQINRANENEIGSSKLISTQGDHIYFYSPVNPETALDLNQRLQQMSMQSLSSIFSTMHEVGNPPPIWLHINSYGGELFSAFAIADTIERIKTTVPVITIVEGCAASAATIISTAGTRRFMRKNSYMLIHELSDSTWGKFTELEDSYTSNIGIMKTMTDWYSSHTKMKTEKLENMLKHDRWLNSATCKKYGLVDEII